MKQVRYYIKDILEMLCVKLSDAKVGACTYAEHRPIGIGEQKDSISVVSLPAEIQNQGAYQNTEVRFDLIVRNRDGGISATDELQEMLDNLLGLFPIVEERYSITSPRLLFKGDDGNGFTVWVVQAHMVINTTDRLWQ